VKDGGAGESLADLGGEEGGETRVLVGVIQFQ
jgi:hypothetical protein